MSLFEGYFATNVLMYALLVIALIVVQIIEKRDWSCINSYNFFAGCEHGEAMPYRGARPQPEDTTLDLLDRIDIASEAEQNSIKWRRSFLIGGFISIILFAVIVTPGRLPDWPKMYACVLISTFVLYFHLNYYSYHRYKVPMEYTKEATERIRNNLHPRT